MGILNVKNGNLAERFTYIAWSIWAKRKASRLDLNYLPYSKIYSDAMERLQEFQSVQGSFQGAKSISPPTVHWSPPPQSLYKANFDGAIFRDIYSARIGVVIRDCSGEIIGSLMERLVLPPTVEDVEALACRRAISFALEIGLQEVMFEGDSDIVIIRSLNSESPCMAPFGHVIEDSRSIASSLRYHSFSHVKRSGNCVADKLAKLARYTVMALRYGWKTLRPTTLYCLTKVWLIE